MVGALLIAQLSALASRNKRFCYEYLSGGNREGKLTQYIPTELVERETALDEIILLTAAPREKPDPARLDQLWNTIGEKLRVRFGDKVQLFAQKSIQPAQQGDYCDVSIGMYQEIMKLPPADAATLLREIQL